MAGKIKIALRTSGHLLLGVVRIYSRKAKYLLADCSEAFVKIKLAFRPGLTDLPSANFEATYKAITLAEDFQDFELQLPDVNAIEVTDHFTLNQSRTEDITLKEDYGNSFLIFDDNFGDEIRLRQGGLFDESVRMSTDESLLPSFESLTDRLRTDGFGDEDGSGFDILNIVLNNGEDILQTDVSAEKEDQQNIPPPDTNNNDRQSPKRIEEGPGINEMTLLDNAEEAFTLEPVPVTPTSERKRGKRKRRLVVDHAKELSNNAIRGQISNCSDIVGLLVIAPPTKQLMRWKEMGGVDKLFTSPCFTLLNSQLLKKGG
ncbi:double-strand-break repair protein rad21-like protein 1 [Amia ocellicauda]|uniref:double-strand-break repair protein rad21-like protein 1 n=1 Tax=Amia ocellicauda TaxID=2972642 RepID=UPI003463E817